MFRSQAARSQRHKRAAGVAASELAVCLPVIVLLVLAMIEACTMVFLKQSLTVSAYEGVRTALRQNATDAEVRQACNAVLADRRVQGGSISIDPANFTTLTPGEYVRISVSAPTDPNSVIPGSFMRGKTFTASASMMIEF